MTKNDGSWEERKSDHKNNVAHYSYIAIEVKSNDEKLQNIS